MSTAVREMTRADKCDVFRLATRALAQYYALDEGMSDDEFVEALNRSLVSLAALAALIGYL